MSGSPEELREIAVVALTEAGASLAQRIADALPGARIHGLARRVADAGIAFDNTIEHLAGLFRAGHPIVGVCASGILIRALAPHLSDKRGEPPVIAVSPDGKSVVPLLGGHAGANALAGNIAALTGGHAALTTAGENIFGIALDEPPSGWSLANPETAKPVMADLLAGRAPIVVVEAGEPDWLSRLPTDTEGTRMVRITDRTIAPAPDELVIHPPTLAVGIGCERGCPPGEVETLVADTLAAHGLATASVALVASIDLKMDEPAILEAARNLARPARFFDAKRLEAETPRLANPSELVFREVGTHGVAEAAALAACGPDGILVAPKRKSARATCAVARGPGLDPDIIGTARGELTIVGTGPGDAAHRTPVTDAAIARAEHLVGYGPYLDLLGGAARGKTRHDFELGAETERCRHALTLAGEGRRVALVSSGDPGVFAMASLAFELIDRGEDPVWSRIAITVEPGISAMQLAAARAGAPLGHDFCAISLSDLLTPWPAIEGRLKAAATADFVVALYNPASRRRRHQLETACDILRAARPTDTPVVVARNLARPGEAVSIVTLSELDPDSIDMLTIVIVGNSQSRMMHRAGRAWAFTPRGYATGKDSKPGP
jgi:cobalt-precorrin 5A hydrolase/precorrin-3B C17-methyltransferase